ncbi:hypothetical protein [Epilithonimonas sp. UC225_85]|uniref:hypothetical protein n=1 Tax=Epilithonimonas sp. UC225_85 TaxID=3350167 RepID=UPI0036D3E5BE
MKNKFLLIVAIFLSLSSFSQTTNNLVAKEIETIYKNYSENCTISKDKILGKYEKTNFKELEQTKEYRDDYSLFLNEKQKHQSAKIAALKSLLKRTEANNPLVGAKTFTNQNNTEFETNFDLVKSQVTDIRNDLIINFNEDYIDAPFDSTLRTKINLVLDSDGKLKNIICTGEDEEMNLYTSLLIYSLDKHIKPIFDENWIRPANFIIPLTLKFE